MFRILILVVILSGFLVIEIPGQTPSRGYWKEIANESKFIVVGTVGEDYKIIRPEKFKPNPDGSSPSQEEIYVGRIFRVKVTKNIKGKIKAEKDGNDKYINVFTYWVSGTGSLSDAKMLRGKEYILFLEPNNKKDLEGKETVEFKPNEIIRKPFDNKSSYMVVQNFRGVIPANNNKEKLIKEIKNVLD
jgi:hypothetical protein